jgi:hypothetical protein
VFKNFVEKPVCSTHKVNLQNSQFQIHSICHEMK